MCFSAGASFGAAAALLPAGVYCVRQAARKDARLLPLALLPVLFGVQQAAEGFVWLSLAANDDEGALRAGLVFLSFALGLWPAWVPLCATFQPLPPARRWAVRLLLAAGLCWGLVYAPVFLDPGRYLSVRLVHHSVHYDYSGLPVYGYVPVALLRVLYAATVAVPMAVAWHDDAVMRRLGVLFAASVLVSWLFFSYAFASVWCFFAAVVSGYLCVVLRALPAGGRAAGLVPAGVKPAARWHPLCSTDPAGSPATTARGQDDGREQAR